MNVWANEIGGSLQLITLCAGLGYLCFRAFSKPPFDPGIWSKLRIRLPGGMARANLQGKSPQGWRIGPVLQREGSAAPRVGDHIVVEVPWRGGVTCFRSKVISIDDDEMTVAPPKAVIKKDRRKSARRTDVGHWPVKIDGHDVGLVDLSPHGAKLSGVSGVSRAQRAELFLGTHACVCWVLEAGPEETARVMFEEPLERWLLKSKTAPSR